MQAGGGSVSDERIVAVVPNATRARGFLGLKRETFTIAVTPSRLVFARMTKTMQAEAMKQAKAEAQAAGTGFFSTWGHRMGAGMTWFERYRSMGADEILAESGDNYALARGEVRSLKVEHYLHMDQGDSKTPLPKLVIRTPSAKLKFMMERGFGGEPELALKDWLEGSPPGR